MVLGSCTEIQTITFSTPTLIKPYGTTAKSLVCLEPPPPQTHNEDRSIHIQPESLWHIFCPPPDPIPYRKLYIPIDPSAPPKPRLPKWLKKDTRTGVPGVLRRVIGWLKITSWMKKIADEIIEKAVSKFEATGDKINHRKIRREFRSRVTVIKREKRKEKLLKLRSAPEEEDFVEDYYLDPKEWGEGRFEHIKKAKAEKRAKEERERKEQERIAEEAAAKIVTREDLKVTPTEGPEPAKPVYWRIKTKIQEILDKIPGPPDIFFNKSFEEKLDKAKEPCENCYPKDGKGGMDLPDDFADIKLEKDLYSYNLRLPNVRPHQFKMLGRNLLNMAYADPQYGKSADDDTDEDDPLPPPPEPSEKVKTLKHPIISVKANDIQVEQLHELGEFFYDIADYMDMGEDGKELPREPTYRVNPDEVAKINELLYDPVKAVEEEITLKKDLTISDLVPGATPMEYQDEVQDWVKLCDLECPDETDDYDLVRVSGN